MLGDVGRARGGVEGEGTMMMILDVDEMWMRFAAPGSGSYVLCGLRIWWLGSRDAGVCRVDSESCRCMYDAAQSYIRAGGVVVMQPSGHADAYMHVRGLALRAGCLCRQNTELLSRSPAIIYWYCQCQGRAYGCRWMNFACEQESSHFTIPTNCLHPDYATRPPL